jgi:hypothetical protein
VVEHRPEVEDRVRLAEHVVHAMFEALLSLGREDPCGQGDDGHVRPAHGGFDLAECLCRFQPVHARHADVHEHDIPVIVRELAKGGLRVLARHRNRAMQADHFRGEDEVGAVVVHDQNTVRAARCRPRHHQRCGTVFHCYK